jgi:hypothetical protein
MMCLSMLTSSDSSRSSAMMTSIEALRGIIVAKGAVPGAMYWHAGRGMHILRRQSRSDCMQCMSCIVHVLPILLACDQCVPYILEA